MPWPHVLREAVPHEYIPINGSPEMPFGRHCAYDLARRGLIDLRLFRGRTVVTRESLERYLADLPRARLKRRAAPETNEAEE